MILEIPDDAIAAAVSSIVNDALRAQPRGMMTDAGRALQERLRRTIEPQLVELMQGAVDKSLGAFDFRARVEAAVRDALVAAAVARTTGAVKSMPKPAVGELEALMRGRTASATALDLRDDPFGVLLAEVLAERKKQIERYGDDHDDDHDDGIIATVAAALAVTHVAGAYVVDTEPPNDANTGPVDRWGLAKKHPETRKRLVIAIALLLRETERLERAARHG